MKLLRTLFDDDDVMIFQQKKISLIFFSYWANHLYEVIFLVATMMPNGDPAQMQATKKRLVNGAPVVITWVEDGEELDGASALAPDQVANIGASLFTLNFNTQFFRSSHNQLFFFFEHSNYSVTIGFISRKGVQKVWLWLLRTTS